MGFMMASFAFTLLLLYTSITSAEPAVCADQNSNCVTWAEAGECQKNRAFMAASCAESCGICKPPPMLEQSDDNLLGVERVVMQITWGDQHGTIVLGFYPSVAPITVAHILKLVRLGGYNTNEIFRVDRGFVAQVQAVEGGRSAPMNKELREVAKQNVPDEFSDVKHSRGLLSMGKFDKPNTGTSSFSMLLGDAPFLDRKYTVFGRVVAGDHVLSLLEQLETVRDGIFVKPKVRVSVVSAVVMYADGKGGLLLDDPRPDTRHVEL